MDATRAQRLREQAKTLRRWHAGPELLVLPNAWDAGSARLFERMGFRAVATTSSGVAAALGYADGERMSRDEMVAAIGRIARVVACPVTADIEAAYGTTLDAKLETIRLVLDAGAVGINIEDSTHDEGHPLAEIAAQQELIRAIRALGEAQGIPLVINARTDVYLYGEGDAEARLAEATRRMNAYREAGADCLFPILVADAETIGALARAVDAPINILASPRTPTLPELAALGVRRVSFGGGLSRAALGATKRVAEELLTSGTYVRMTEELLPADDWRGLFGG
ncbi:MAG TPA: isocitrate lyase/phosphoenolpyruvate mutase family protein [Ktedonobacterales bacterium]|nr:isocitrate lyase/phosphoenolpyruvate mutase family protein [Ktedonobacterales bacterium]